MTYTIDFVDGVAIEWRTTGQGVEAVRNPEYTPSLFVGVRDGDLDKLDALGGALAADPKVAATTRESWFTGLGEEIRDPVLRVDLDRPSEVRTLAREIRTIHEFGTYAPGTFELYNVDFSPQFRYCLETGTDPTPAHRLTTLTLELPERALVDDAVDALRIEGDPVDHADERAVLATLQRRLDAVDPDVLILNTADLVPCLAERAAELGVEDFRLGRRPGYHQLAGESELHSYGQILHSPARYSVPGRAIIDRANSFMWSKSGLPGLLDLVARSWKPLQEAGWASIGNLLTAIQIREALDREVLIPWNKHQHEYFKTVEDLHGADRGGFIFDPDVGLFEDVYELDFSSLYPNIMIEHNISPETVLCDCHADRADVPEIGYNICEEQGFIPDVLAPIVEDRDDLKRQRRETDADADAERDRLAARSDALKWILVTCFGYQGYKNSKFGRIEAHEAINAFARDILLEAKAIFEANGWRVVHGIVDSIWVERADADPTPIKAVAATITEAVDIRLEFEHAYEWLCFVPKRGSSAGALTKYFGKLGSEDGYKVRGIELRQRSTPPLLVEAQRAMLDALDRERTPEAVVACCQQWLERVRAHQVDPDDLVIEKRVSKPLEAYSQRTHSVGALQRYRSLGIEKRPGQHVEYLVVDDEARQPSERVRLAIEECAEYDAEWYVDHVVRACESIVAPLGWTTVEIEQFLRDRVDVGLSAFD